MANLMPYRFNRNPIARSEFPFMDDFFRSFFLNAEPAQTGLRVDVKDEGDHYLLEADLPGFKRDDVHIEVDGGVLTITAEADASKEEKQGTYLYNERRQMKFQRSFTLNGIDEAGISAKCQDGVLQMVLPKQAEQPKTGRRIEIE
ncbi:MAG: Hsp20/alpha crystallin family protein [Christensenellaceae bacterium]|nr:Hsp20/alpha crystallin family protein [Christensenellaceae bacterium]MEA5065904.1 Hsp20/alpha crystallin family protein [Eubacteriales bacterium]MEA5068961.1 Hsp20/alpha crystallin family protein [Christensenellaceae bacterium]